MLDLGCGAGAIAEFVSDRTAANVTGLDYAAPAIEEARERTSGKRQSRLTFTHGDINSLALPDHSFDAIISIDTLYWVADLKSTRCRGFQSCLRVRTGKWASSCMENLCRRGARLLNYGAGKTSLGRALDGTRPRRTIAYDYTLQNAAFWDRIYQAAKDLREEFDAEGNGFIAANLIRESEEDFLPFIEAGTTVRFLYHVRI